MNTTWDGKEISREPPFGASIVIYRFDGDRCKILVLHRAWQGSDYEGDWAWTPPSGARQPGETIEQCAQRELEEETGLMLTLKAAIGRNERWPTFFSEMPTDATIRLDEEHDRFTWALLDDAIARCRPQQVSDAIVRVAKELGLVYAQPRHDA